MVDRSRVSPSLSFLMVLYSLEHQLASSNIRFAQLFDAHRDRLQTLILNQAAYRQKLRG